MQKAVKTKKTKKNKVITTLQQGNQSELKKEVANKVTKIKADTKSYDGHRQRVREKFLKTPQTCGYQTYELIEMLLFYCNKRSDVKPLAKQISSYFGNSVQAILNTKHHELEQFAGIGDNFLCLLKLIKELQLRNLFENVNNTPQKISHFDDLIKYLQVFYRRHDREIFKVILLDAKNNIIADEVMSQGTANQSAVYPREIVKKCLEHHTVNVVMAHNHPSGDANPSKADIEITQNVKKALATIDVNLLDHIIIAKNNIYSFRMEGLL